ncbi:MAG TPA: M20/M25/M40 family metallo-hydrolase [Fimbriimonadaceae bacterium]|nr:M20/M25/M40 family metallo-hydrolase [Fimbriimonadaceae bacterium]
MDLFRLIRQLVDIESITENEEACGEFLYRLLGEMAQRHGGTVERMDVAPRRFNVFASFGEPVVTLSTHFDTVPPFIPFSEDDEWVYGRGSIDAKGILACMIVAAEELLESGERDLGLLFMVGEERNSAGAYAAAKEPRGSRFVINGEPTENRLALGSKGALRFEITCHGKMAHSAYPELGESAIDKLLVVLERLKSMPLPIDRILGPSTLNIGLISGGRAPNVIPDRAGAEILIRLVSDPTGTRAMVQEAVSGLGEAKEVLCIPAKHLGSLPGYATTTVSYTTDIPALGEAWGEPFLLGPGTIHVAHTEHERANKQELLEAVGLYQRLVRDLWERAR